MVVETRKFTLPKELDLPTALAGIAEELRIQAEPANRVQRLYYDSFDWRVYGCGALLVAETDARSRRFHWLNRSGGEVLFSAPLNTPLNASPGFASDLPPGRLRDKLVNVLDMRRLLPVMEVRSRVHAYSLLNGDGKIVVRLCIEDSTAIDPATQRRKSLGRTLKALPLKGYRKTFRRVLKHLQDHLRLPALGGDPLTIALASHGRAPCDYSAKPAVPLEPELRADAAVRRILLRLLDILERNEPGIRADLDSEFLHDFRVAGRRSRSVLGQIKQIFPLRVVERFRNDLAWLNQVSGPTRDLDVYRLTFPDYQASLPPEVQQDLEPLRAFLIARQKIAHQQLLRALDSARYRRFKQAWRGFLESPLPPRTTLSNARRPVLDVASERIWRLFRRTIKEGAAIGPASPPEDLHELRKTCKKLRYLLECFQRLYPPEDMTRLIKALKTLQNNLGDFQDLHVQIVAMQGFGTQMLEKEHASAPALMALGMLVENLERRQQRAREEFDNRFAAFAGAGHRRLFKRLFRPRYEDSA
jgi:CHAD domain-containing protein